MSFDVSVCTWNVGTDRDFAVMEQNQNIIPKKMGFYQKIITEGQVTGEKIDYDGITEHRNQKIKEIFESYPVDIYCLQEVGGEEKRRLESWFDTAKYQMVTSADPVVVYNAERFEEVYSTENNRGYLIVDLRERTTNKVVRVVSAHLTSAGNPRNPSPQEAAQGDEDLDDLLEELGTRDRAFGADAMIIGLDANAPSEYTGRIGKLVGDGYQMDFNTRDTGILIKGYIEGKHRRIEDRIYGMQAKIDHIGAKSLKSVVEMRPSGIDNLVPLGNLEENPSDHRPIFSTIHIRDRTWSYLPYMLGIDPKLISRAREMT